MPGAVPPPAEDYEVRYDSHVVRDSDCGLNSHDNGTLRGLADFLDERSDRGWEALSVHRVVWVPDEPVLDANGATMRGREVRHEIALRRSPPRKKWLYKIDALSDPINPQVETVLSARVREGWELIGCSTFNFRAVTTGMDGNALEHHTIDAVLVFKRPAGKRR
jgi:hypothetical protein